MMCKPQAVGMSLVVLLALVSPASAQTPISGSTPASTSRNGTHDFDFLLGTWRTRYHILKKRLVGSHDWYWCDGSSKVTAFWDHAGNVEDSTLICPTRHVRGVTLRLYNSSSHQWSLYVGTTKVGLITSPQVGHFNDHRIGEFLGADTQDDKPVIVRYRWTVLSGNRPFFEQAESADGGKTWETDWTTVYTRTADTLQL